MYAIEIDNVHKYYGDLHSLKGVSFNVQQGEFFALLGPNGAGKSTLINSMAGLVKPSAGHIRIQGCDVVADYRHARRQIGVVPQEIVFDPFFTVRESLYLQLGYMGLKKREHQAWLDELLETLDLSAKADSRVKSLSGGMKRRVLIAQALVHRPPVVVLDEPTAGVDVELRQTLWQFANRLHKQGHTIVLTTHYLEEAESLCERIAIINQGQLQALENKVDLMQRHPYRILDVLVEQGSVVPAVLQSKLVLNDEERWSFKLHKQQDPITDVLQQLKMAQVVVQDIETHSPGLEEVFIEMTQRTHKESEHE
jgi:ABC-2 type transport system ATP-binding protein